MIEEILRQIVKENKEKGVNPLVIRNYLKDYLQYLVLYLIYNQNRMKELIFKGESCLRICFDLPRLSEDLDFDYDRKTLGDDFLYELKKFLEQEIKKKYFPLLETKVQADLRIYLKFPVLRKLGLATQSESDKLYVKIEASSAIAPFANFTVTPISKYGYNFIVKSYDLPSLMSGKINALLTRIWLKGKKNEVDIKGRDFYDLYWFFQKRVEPNWKMLKKMTGIKNSQELKSALKERIKKTVTAQKLTYDLKNFIADEQFVKDFSKNYSLIMERYFKN
jgi:predicted nucleotidyltransferase component of viral defense system